MADPSRPSFTAFAPRGAAAATVALMTVALPVATAGAASVDRCTAPDHPTPSCTGVPVGTAVTRTVDGDYTARTDGEVIDALHITGDLIIEASHVVVHDT